MQYKYMWVIQSSDLYVGGHDEQALATFNINVGMLNKRLHCIGLGIKTKLQKVYYVCVGIDLVCGTKEKKRTHV